ILSPGASDPLPSSVQPESPPRTAEGNRDVRLPASDFVSGTTTHGHLSSSDFLSTTPVQLLAGGFHTAGIPSSNTTVADQLAGLL
ncbi:unnamed protein product, partial [Amoebophrya sp. A25]